MRLVCPNCEAKYEVPDDAIPDTGRDVQCANCGHAWFQMRHKAATVTGAAAEPVAAAPLGASVPMPDVEPVVQPAAEMPPEPFGTVIAPQGDAAEPRPFIAAGAEAASGGEDSTPAGAGVIDPEPTRAPAGYAVDDSVLAILREEADREARARRANVRPLESQPDLGLDSALSPTEKRAAMLKGDDAAAAKTSARRDLLPDVEEINSTLRPAETPVEEVPVAEAPIVVVEDRGGFRSGFLVVMALAIFGIAIYLSAPQLGGAVPALADPLDTYVSFIDGMRLQLDGLMKSATLAINGEAG